jgi:hypothetical protein
MSDITQILRTATDFALMGGEFLGVLIMGIGIGIAGVIRRRKKTEKQAKEDEKKQVIQDSHQVMVHTRVHEHLTELRVTVRASRCLVFQFHNGGKFADGSSIKRVSVTHESCGSGVKSMMIESQDVMLNRYMDLIRILNTSPDRIIAVDTLPESAFRSSFEINNVLYFTVSPLKCMDGITPLGFVCCHWCSREGLDEIEKDGISEHSVEQVIESNSRTINAHLTAQQER